jgi:hypothetical protein
MKKIPLLFMGLLLTVALVTSCKKDKDDDTPAKPAGKLKFTFEHYVDGNPLIIDSMMYVNAAGNHYLVYEVQYFVTDVVLYKSDGSQKMIKDWTDYHYVDTNIPATLEWSVYDSIDPGNYDSIAFHFGFSNEKNESFMFLNPPEKDMVWPEYLGGGYHYMKLNGKWLDTNNYVRGFSFHIGKGQHYDNNGVPVPPFIDNSFRVSLPSSSFSVSDGKTTEIKIRMNIENWFKDPNVYDHNKWGGDIMQRQPAMALASENGWNVFSVVK